MLKQAFFKFQLQNPQDSLIDLAFIQKSLFNSLTKAAKGFIPQTHIHTCTSCRNCCMQRIALRIFQEIHSQSVCHHYAVKAHLTAQYVAQQPCISVAVYAVDFVVCCHDAFHTGFTARFCRRKVNLSELTLTNSCRTRIYTAGRLTLRAKMLCHTADACGLHTGHSCFCHCCGKARIFRVALFTSSPTRITRDIQCRHQRQLYMPAF